MRPVIKGSAAVNNYAYDNNSIVDFSRTKYKQLAIDNLMSDQPSVSVCSTFLVGLIKGTVASNNGTLTLKKGIQDKFATMYRTAAIPLFTRLGAYCSFCGNIITTHLEVEHCIPKANYPTYTVIWDNFLIACGPCNYLKSNIPARSVVQGWLVNPNPTEDQYYDCIRNQHFVWADLNASSYRDLEAELWYYSNSNMTWALVPAPGDTDLNNTIVSTDVSTREVIANINLLGTMVPRKVEVRISSATNPSNRGQELIDLCQLNTIGNTVNTSDRRLFSRTQAYFNALQVLSTLLNAIVDQQIFNLFWPNYLTLAKTNGFYAVFLLLLAGRTDPSMAALDQRFVTDTNTPLYFPNTNTAQLP